LGESFVIVPDYDNHRLQKFSENGTLIGVFGASGEPLGEFDNPHSVDVEFDGNIYVSDKDNHKIQKFSIEGDFVIEFGYEGTGNGEFTHLHGIALDPIGAFWLCYGYGKL
jgi:DNA-binding beta-propeller fold protein YncE